MIIDQVPSTLRVKLCSNPVNFISDSRGNPKLFQRYRILLAEFRGLCVHSHPKAHEEYNHLMVRCGHRNVFNKKKASV